MSNEGKKVKVHYTGTLDDGTTFDSSVERGEPIEFTCMAGQMIPGFDAAVKDMAVGETKTVRIPAAEAYGERDEGKVQQVPISQIPNGDQLPAGQTVYMMGPGGQPFPCSEVHRERHRDVRHEPRACGQGPHVRDHAGGSRRLTIQTDSEANAGGEARAVPRLFLVPDHAARPLDASARKRSQNSPAAASFSAETRQKRFAPLFVEPIGQLKSERPRAHGTIGSHGGTDRHERARARPFAIPRAAAVAAALPIRRIRVKLQLGLPARLAREKPVVFEPEKRHLPKRARERLVPLAKAPWAAKPHPIRKRLPPWRERVTALLCERAVRPARRARHPFGRRGNRAPSLLGIVEKCE